MKIGFIGIGKVGFAIANHLQKLGHEIVIGTKNPQSGSVMAALSANTAFTVSAIQDMIDAVNLIFLATPFGANQEILHGLAFRGKILVDCTNPVGPGITHGLQSKKSGAEAVQEWAPDARVVKAFNIYGFENFVDNAFPAYNVMPLMLMAGDDKAAKQIVGGLLSEMNYFPKDTGSLSQALHLEHMTLLWVKMVRMNGHHPSFVWGYLER